MTIINLVTLEAAQGGSKVSEFFKTAVTWMGHTIKVGFQKLVELIKTCWTKGLPLLKTAALQLFTFARTAPGFALAGFFGAVVLGGVPELVNMNRWAALAMRIGAGVCLVGTGVALGMGFVLGFKTPLV